MLQFPEVMDTLLVLCSRDRFFIVSASSILYGITHCLLWQQITHDWMMFDDCVLLLKDSQSCLTVVDHRKSCTTWLHLTCTHTHTQYKVQFLQCQQRSFFLAFATHCSFTHDLARIYKSCHPHTSYLQNHSRMFLLLFVFLTWFVFWMNLHWKGFCFLQ